MVRGRATIHDVAREAGVAPSTVSRVLNDHPAVTEETRQRVLAAVARLRYVPNSFAKSLRTNQSYLLGLVVPDISNPFYPELARGLQDRAAVEGYSVILYNTDGRRAKEIEALEALRRYVEGLVIFPQAIRPEEIVRYFGKGRPAVVCDARDVAHTLPVLRTDDVRAAELATDHLLSVGCRKVGFAGVRVNAYTARLAGYKRSLERAGIPFRRELELVLGSVADRDEVERGLRALVFEAGVDGIVCVNDALALRVIRTLHEIGVKVPHDVAVIGFDNIQAGTLSLPTLSTIDYNKYEMGKWAAELLFAAMASPSGKVHFEAARGDDGGQAGGPVGRLVDAERAVGKAGGDKAGSGWADESDTGGYREERSPDQVGAGRADGWRLEGGRVEGGQAGSGRSHGGHSGGGQAEGGRAADGRVESQPGGLAADWFRDGGWSSVTLEPQLIVRESTLRERPASRRGVEGASS